MVTDELLPMGSEQAPAPASAQVLYRKWRPQSFAEVVGQEAVTRTLRNSVASGRPAHAYLLCGPRGTGKTSLGRLIAKAANCTSPLDGEPCNQCDSCRAFVEGRAIDFIEQDAASHNSVDDIRQLRENVVLNPMSGRYKVYLLDEVHMLSKGAENALLKTLEEPPPHVIFVLATTEPHKVESTIISRCQRFDLRRIPLPAAAEVLSRICGQEGYTLDEASLQEIARSATGSLRDAINGLEQVVTYYGPSPSLGQVQEALGLTVDARSGELARLALAGDVPGGLRLIAAVRDDGVDMRHFKGQVVRYLRGLLLAGAGVSEALDLPAEAVAEVKAAAARLDSDDVARALRIFGRTEFRDDPSASGGSLPLELALLELVSGPTPAVDEAPGEAVAAARAEPRQKRSKPEPASAVPPAEAPAAEEKAVAAAEPAASVGQAPSTSSSQALVERVRQACKDTDKQLSALLNGSCEVTSTEGELVTLGFYHTFHLERIEQGAFGPRLAELFSAELGRPVKVAFVHSPRAPTPGRIEAGHLVRAAQKLGAKPVGRKGDEGGEPPSPAGRDEP
ncbi:MAG TPA: DNA polymerase III subunit gamma/tau [Dehalococcoidia bacterium]|nr:DNA polymerase III subunit gamma/tau [Dehalococcoidia bacterium]